MASTAFHMLCGPVNGYPILVGGGRGILHVSFSVLVKKLFELAALILVTLPTLEQR